MAGMNSNHDKVCPSPEWAEHLHTDVLPRVTAGVDLGTEMLELGPGPGAATDWLRRRVTRLHVLELDPDAAEELATKFADSNVEVHVGDATALPWPAESFDAVGSFTMLHHVPTNRLQDRILAEAHRVLRPGGALIGSDSAASNELHRFHEGDDYNPIEPASFLTRLLTLGFERITLGVDHTVTFSAHKPLG
jgi:SAM-dependent methyltransferase